MKFLKTASACLTTAHAAAGLAERGYVTPSGKHYSAASVASMIGEAVNHRPAKWLHASPDPEALRRMNATHRQGRAIIRPCRNTHPTQSTTCIWLSGASVTA